MNRSIIVLFLILFAGLTLVAYQYRLTGQGVSVGKQTSSQPVGAQQRWEPKIDSWEDVTVTVTPEVIDLSSKAAEWKFNVVMNTHSVELDQDLVEVATLSDDDGQEYRPLRWEGSPVGGHHREGALVFAPIMPYPQHLILNIKGVDGTRRSFSWIIN